jgi:3-oxoacyl-[acyl-carrier protein] reductase
MDQRVAIVTGAGRGLGFATGCELARRGYLTVFTARDGVALNRAAEAIPTGTDIRLMPLDITRQADVDALIRFVRTQFGRADVLVNNAGILLEGDIERGDDPSAFAVAPETVLKTWRPTRSARTACARLSCR